MTKRMFNEFDQMFGLFEQVFSNLNDFVDFEVCSPNVYCCPTFPPTNVWIHEKDRDLCFEFAVAGYKEDQIDLSFEGDNMTLVIADKNCGIPLGSPEKKCECGCSKDGYKLLHQGIKAAKVNNRYFVPSAKYDHEKVKASLADGVLCIRIPAREEIKHKKVTINL